MDAELNFIIHKPDVVAIEGEVTRKGLSLPALGLYLHTQCNDGEISTAQLADAFKMAPEAIDDCIGELARLGLIKIVERG